MRRSPTSAAAVGGPGIWLARTTGAHLIGIDFSPVAAAQAQHRARIAAAPAAFIVADMTATGLADHTAAAAVSVDALQYARSRPRAAAEARRILHPGGRLVLTGWHPRRPGDPGYPSGTGTATGPPS